MSVEGWTPDQITATSQRSKRPARRHDLAATLTTPAEADADPGQTIDGETQM